MSGKANSEDIHVVFSCEIFKLSLNHIVLLYCLTFGYLFLL